MNTGEQWVTTGLVIVVLVAFFFPLTFSTVPIAGTTASTGYDILSFSSDARQFEESLASLKGAFPDVDAPGAATAEIPLALRAAVLLKFWIAALFLAAGAVGAASFIGHRLMVIWASGVGGLAGVIAIVHLKVMNSEMHEFAREQIGKIPDTLKDNPFAGMMQGLGQMLVTSIEIGPGPGLYLVTLILFSILFLIRTGLISRLRIQLAPVSSDSRARDRWEAGAAGGSASSVSQALDRQDAKSDVLPASDERDRY